MGDQLSGDRTMNDRAGADLPTPEELATARREAEQLLADMAEIPERERSGLDSPKFNSPIGTLSDDLSDRTSPDR